MDSNIILLCISSLLFSSVSGRDVSCGSSTHFTIGFTDTKEIICATTHITLAENSTLRYIDSRERDFNVLEFYGCSINAFPREIFGQFEHLRKVKMTGNDLKSIKDRTFEGAGTLRELHLNRNKLEQITRDTFKGATKLSHLNLEHNNIQNVSVLAFDTLQSLETLNLAYNLIKELPFGLFTPLTNLKELHLYNNKVTQIHPKSFWHNRALEILDMEGNFLENLELHVNSHRMSLLDVTNNEISHFTVQGNAKNSSTIRKILASNNHIVQIEVSMELKTEIIDMNRNKLEHFENLTLPWTTLKSLNLAFNPIKFVTEDEKFRNLHHLDLSYTDINIDVSYFHNFEALTVLYLKGLHIKVLETHGFEGLDNLRMLNLYDNPLEFAKNGIFEHLSSLSQMTFQMENFECQNLIEFYNFLSQKNIIITRDEEFPLEITDFHPQNEQTVKMRNVCLNFTTSTSTSAEKVTEKTSTGAPEALYKVPSSTSKTVSQYYNFKILFSLIMILIVVVFGTVIISLSRCNIGPQYSKFRNSWTETRINNIPEDLV